MKRYLVLIFILFPTVAYAGANLQQSLQAAQQQRQAQQQQLLERQRALQQGAVAQQQSQAIAARQQQIMQQQIAQQQAAIAQQRSAVQNSAAQQQAQQFAQQQAAYNQALQQQQVLQSQPNNASQQPFAPFAEVYEPYVEETVDMAKIWNDLNISSEVWPLMIDMDAKEIVVTKFIQDFRTEGIVINKTAGHYAQMIDSMSFDNPDMLKNPFKNVLQIVAIIEYDFDNGINPDRLAQQVLGNSYESNKRRLGK